MHGVLGLHRHVVRLIELGDVSYVIKELPNHLVEREYRLLHQLEDDGLPTAEVVAAVTGKADNVDGMLITRHLDYSIPYRTLLSGRGLTIPYLGERVLDAMAGLLVRLHLAGYFWGDCSLSNTLFRRDAGALSAYVIDMETGEHYDTLSDGQRTFDLQIATENFAGGLLDLQAGGRLAADIDPWETTQLLEERYSNLWNELTAPANFAIGETFRIEQRLERLHDLGFDVEEMDIVGNPADGQMRYIPRVVEHGYHSQRLKNLTGLETTENQARRLLGDIRAFGAELHHRRAVESASTGVALRSLPENVVAVRWLDQQFEPLIASVPPIHVRQARSSRVVSPAPRAPLVPVRAARRRRVTPSGARLLHPRRPRQRTRRNRERHRRRGQRRAAEHQPARRHLNPTVPLLSPPPGTSDRTLPNRASTTRPSALRLAAV